MQQSFLRRLFSYNGVTVRSSVDIRYINTDGTVIYCVESSHIPSYGDAVKFDKKLYRVCDRFEWKRVWDYDNKFIDIVIEEIE